MVRVCRKLVTGLALMSLLPEGAAAQSDDSATKAQASAVARARQTVAAMQQNEKTILTLGILPAPIGTAPVPVPADALPGAGYIAGIPRLGIPALRETDASLGVAWAAGLRKDGATALPSGLAMASTWNPTLLRQGGAMIGSEARAKGFNVMLAGGANLTRDPRNGRTFEYLSEDPLLTGVLVGHAIQGIQSNGIISTIKHLALNGQETGRQYANVKISDSAARESDLLAFQIGIEIGRPGAVMCSYNRVGGRQGCESDYLINQVLKRDWKYPGFVMSDWGAVHRLEAALAGLDQQSGSQLDPSPFFGKALADAAVRDQAYAARLDDMNVRILSSIYALGLDRSPAVSGGEIDFSANARIAEETAKQGIVLLRNHSGMLPLTRKAIRIAVIGGNANIGVLSGGGSSQVHAKGGPVGMVSRVRSDHPFANFLAEQYQGNAPVEAIAKEAPEATVTYRSGNSVSEAVAQARMADVAIVFANSWSTEGFDQPDLSLPGGQDALIEAVAQANPNTVVVLQTGNPVLMPWLDKTRGVIQAWYSGARGAEAIASVLFGSTNPSGRLPITFPAAEAQLPRPRIDGFDKVVPDFVGNPPPGDDVLDVDYDIEGSDVGYRWYARHGLRPLFPFGYGLSYTTFAASDLKVKGFRAQLTLANTGERDGATVGQLFLTSRNGKPTRHLVGFSRAELKAHEKTTVELTIDPRLLADWQADGWVMEQGLYTFAIGDNAETLGKPVSVRFGHRYWKD